MGIRVDRFWVVYESIAMEAIDPEYLGIDKEDILKYMKENPMPKDPEYSPEDLIIDVTQSSGFLKLPDAMQPETRGYVAELIGELKP